jgi:hypothetical protein
MIEFNISHEVIENFYKNIGKNSVSKYVLLS